MKKIAFVFLICFGFLSTISPAAFAQENRQERFARIEAEKVAFITKELQLTPAEAQRFFPLYNAYGKEMSGIMQSSRTTARRMESRSRNNIDELAIESRILELKKKYRNEFAKVIGASRASRFFEAEREFREKLFLELRRRGGGRGNEAKPF